MLNASHATRVAGGRWSDGATHDTRAWLRVLDNTA